MKMCDYGCGKEAKFQMTSGKWCCESYYSKCPSIKNKTKCSGPKNGSYGKKFIGKEIINLNNKICDFGCGKEAKYYFKSSKKYCCSDSCNSCEAQIEKNRISNTKKIKRKKPDLCDYGCGKEAKYYFKSADKWCCSKNFNMCEKNKLITGRLGHSNVEYYGLEKSLDISFKHKKTKTGKPSKKLGKSLIEQIGEERAINVKQKLREGRLGKTWEQIMGIKKSKELKEKLSYRMLNGGHDYISSFIKKISKEEKQLRELVQQIYSSCIFQYKVFRYEIDVAIPEYKIAIEFDGYFHFNTPENIEYHKMRQERIESQGWKFYRVTMFDKFPTLEEVKENIEMLIKESNEATN